MSVENARDKNMSAGLLRQRRNLIGISTIVPLYLFSGAKFEKINILGNQVTIQNPKIIGAYLFILFFYFFLRYLQYFKEENHVKNAKNEIWSFQKTFVRTQIDHSFKLKFNYYEKFIYNQEIRQLTDSIVERRLPDNSYEINHKGILTREYSVRLKFINADRSEKPIILSNGEPEILHDIIDKDQKWKHIETKDNNEIYKSFISLNILKLFLNKKRGYIQFILTKTTFTDYYLPFIICFFSLISCIVWL